MSGPVATVQSAAVSQASSSFRIVVADLLGEPGRRRTVRVEASVDWGIELSRIAPSPPLTGEISLEGAAGGVFASGTAAASVEHTCHRCTAVWTEEVEVSLQEMLDREPDGEYPIDGDVADLEPPIRDALILALPLLPICRPDCLGLCAQCGADLNTGACPGHDEEPTSPFAGLREMLEP